MRWSENRVYTSSAEGKALKVQETAFILWALHEWLRADHSASLNLSLSEEHILDDFQASFSIAFYILQFKIITPLLWFFLTPSPGTLFHPWCYNLKSKRQIKANMEKKLINLNEAKERYRTANLSIKYLRSHNK